METILKKHKTFWTQKGFLLNVALGVVLLTASFFINSYANFYTAQAASNSVTDILLDNLPVVNVDFIVSEGAIIFVGLVVLIHFFEPKYLPFTLKTAALFIAIRSTFMILTHFAPPLHQSAVDTSNFLERLMAGSGYDLFFSGHTGMPFLLGFIFWEKKYLRYFFFACSIIAGISVILGHLHYSIDVFSALFISYGIFKLATCFFAKDYERLAV